MPADGTLANRCPMQKLRTSASGARAILADFTGPKNGFLASTNVSNGSKPEVLTSPVRLPLLVRNRTSGDPSATYSGIVLLYPLPTANCLAATSASGWRNSLSVFLVPTGGPSSGSGYAYVLLRARGCPPSEARYAPSWIKPDRSRDLKADVESKRGLISDLRIVPICGSPELNH
jgi:hypothetical protein